MSPVLIAIIITITITIAIVGGYIIDYQKNKLKWQVRNRQSDEEVGELRKLMGQMKKRVENLEAIAAGDPDNFKRANIDPLDRIEIEETDAIKKENEKNVANMAKTKGE